MSEEFHEWFVAAPDAGSPVGAIPDRVGRFWFDCLQMKIHESVNDACLNRGVIAAHSTLAAEVEMQAECGSGSTMAAAANL